MYSEERSRVGLMLEEGASWWKSYAETSVPVTALGANEGHCRNIFDLVTAQAV